MNELHEKIIEQLENIDSICRKYSITYYAAGGTTIGAIRHRGFIPWDDDADLYMTRDNFYKFRDAFKKEKKAGNFKNKVLECLDDNPEYPGTIPRFINDDTALVAKYHCLNTCAAGIVVDIFILDPVPDDPELQKEHIGKLNIYADLVMPYYGYTHRANDRYLEMFQEYERRIETEGRETVIKELEKDLFSMKEEDSNYYILRWATVPHIFKKDMFSKPVYFQYENIQIPCPARWYDYLVMLYGPKWMYFPPHIEDEAHSFYVDCNHKYTNYLVDADRFIPKEQAKSIYRKRKSLFVQRELLTRPFKNDVLVADSKCTLASQKKYIEKNNIDIKKLSEDKRYAEIVKIYKVYLDMQFSQKFIGKMTHQLTYRYNNKVFIELNDSELEILAEALFYTNGVKRCKELIELRMTKGRLTDKLTEVYNKTLWTYDLYKRFYSKEYSTAEILLSKFTDDEKNLVTDIKKIWFQIRIINGENYDSLYNQINSIGNPDSEYIKILGDLYYREGLSEKARACYEKAVPGLTNGIMLLDIGDKYDIEMNYDTPIDLTMRNYMQDKRLNLLSEINDICHKNNINYYLTGDTLLYGYYEHILCNDYKSDVIVMKPEDALRFIEICNKSLPENRKIEYPLNNANHSSHSVYYCDSDTVSLDWRNFNESYGSGIHITIYILKKKDSNAVRWAWTRCLDILSNVESRLGKKSVKFEYRIAGIISKTAIAVLGKKRIQKMIFNGYINATVKSKNAKYFLSGNDYKNKAVKYYEEEYFTGKNTINVYDRKFSVPNDTENYIKNEYGKYAYKDVKVRKQPIPFYEQVDCNLNMHDIQNIIKYNEIFSEKDIRDFTCGRELSPEIRKLNKKVDKYWNILLRAEDRFKLYLKYTPLKDKIKGLYEKQDYDSLKTLLSDYDKYVRKNLKNGLGLMFDQDITNIYCELLKMEGEEKLAEKLIKIIPEEHKEAIQIKI